MKPRSQLRALASTIALLLGSASLSQADPILISAGFLQMDGPFGTLELAGNRGFTLFGRVSVFGGAFFPDFQCNTACAPGSTVSLGATWVGSDLNGTATLDGRSYGVGGVPGSGPSAASAFVLFTGSVVLPALVGESASVSAPFLFSGNFSPEEQPPPRVELRGRGTATLAVRRSDIPGTWAYSSARYEFAPIPEPGTLFLVGGGLAAYGARAYRRRTSTRGSV
jgi:hypothetical protein